MQEIPPSNEGRRRACSGTGREPAGEEFYIYASMKPGEIDGFAMLDCRPSDLPTGVLVGKARISKCVEVTGQKLAVRKRLVAGLSDLTSDL